ncbi:ParB/RepB/Spo0J family partition protein (plasmid) [Streptomyces sp. NBC_01723]|uniref:ParB/RepB/Spo0J family partition protein n=1 Tax=Streptomyces sp. NBC_01723 TaxID=2975921 RepID=UPI002E32FF2A|nr:ParB/RepB/Spo0J family partition protein [Streptomyces sp. NBC_01723]
MSKADTLGKSAAFGAASQARPSRRDLIRGIGGQDTAASINDVPVTLISENPDNPRNHLRNLDEMVESIREVGVILPIVIGTADAYLRDRADRADDLDDGTQYVVIDGHRRLEAARRVGLATIPVRVDNARLATDEAILEAAFVANYHRDDMTDLEEAHALKQLVDYYGSQSKASKRLGISQSNISSKLSLLKLAPDLQKDLMTGERRVEHVRNLGKLSPEEQRSKADQRAEASRRKTEENPENVVERVAGPADYHGVIIPEAAAKPAPRAEKSEPARPAPTPSERVPEVIPEPRSTPSETRPPRPIEYDKPGALGMLLDARMEEDHLFQLLHILAEKARTRDPERLRSLVQSLPEASTDHTS